MKAILLLLTLVSTNAFAEIYSTEYRMEKQNQEREMCRQRPEFCKAMSSYRLEVANIKRLNNHIAYLGRVKAGLCSTVVHGERGVMADTRWDAMQICKASNRYKEDNQAIDQKIALANAELAIASAMAEDSKVVVSYLYAKGK